MKFYPAIAALLLLFCAGPALAGPGPGNLVPGAIAYYGLRAYESGYTGRALALRRESDGAVRDISILKSGRLDIRAARRFCANTRCTVAIWYDQTGHGHDAVQTNPAMQPIFAVSAAGIPSLRFDYGTGQILPNGQNFITVADGADAPEAGPPRFLFARFPWVAGNAPWSGQAALLSAEPTGWYEPIFEYGDMGEARSLYALVAAGQLYQFAVSIYGHDRLSRIPTHAPAALTFYSTGSMVGGYVNGQGWSAPYAGAAVTGTWLNIGGSPAQQDIWLHGSLGELILYPRALSPEEAQKLARSERAFFHF